MEMALGMSQSETNDEGWRGTDRSNQLKTIWVAQWWPWHEFKWLLRFAGGYRHANGNFVSAEASEAGGVPLPVALMRGIGTWAKLRRCRPLLRKSTGRLFRSVRPGCRVTLPISSGYN